MCPRPISNLSEIINLKMPGFISWVFPLDNMGRRKSPSLSSVDLFAGCGGLTRGLESAGFETLAFNEINKNAAESFKLNFPNAMSYVGNIADVLSNEVVKSDLIPKIGGEGELDLLCGGPPCQEYSRSQVRRSEKVESKDVPTTYLFQDMIRLNKILRPKIYLFENVEGLLTTKWTKKGEKGEVFRRVHQEFQQMDEYVMQPTLVHSYNFGVPQNRPRVMIMGVRKDIYAKSDFDIIEFDPLEEKYLSGKSTYSSALRNNGGLFPISNGKKFPDLVDALSDLDFEGWREERPRHRKKPKTDFQRQMRSGLGDNWRKHALHDHEFSDHSELVIERFQYMIDHQCSMKECPEHLQTKKNNQKSTPRRWKGKTPTFTCQSIPDDVSHYSKPRTYSVREWARLQTFPDHHLFCGPRTTGGHRRAGKPSEGKFLRECPKYTQIGNAVPPFLAESIGFRIKDILKH